MNEPRGARRATGQLSPRFQGEPVRSADADGGGPHSAPRRPPSPPLHASPRGGRAPGGAHREPSPAAKPGLRVASASPALEARPLSPGLQVYVGRLPGVWGDRRHSAADRILQQSYFRCLFVGTLRCCAHFRSSSFNLCDAKILGGRDKEEEESPFQGRETGMRGGKKLVARTEKSASSIVEVVSR